MSLSVSKLRGEYIVRQWAGIIEKHDYIAVMQLTAGANWGRSNLKWRILSNAPEGIGAKFAVPRAARAGAERTRYAAMGALFRGAPCAVVYGDNAPDVARVVRQADTLLRDAVLIGGRFGDELVFGNTWRRAVDMDADKPKLELLGTLAANSTGLLATTKASARGLNSVLQHAAFNRIVRMLDVRAEQLENETGKY